MIGWIPNALTLVRGLAALIVPALLLSGSRGGVFIAAPVFICAALTDWLDGLLARKFACETRFGKLVDPLVDKILIIAPLMAFSALKLFSFIWIIPIAAREIIVTFCRTGWVFQGKAIGAERLGKIKMVIQVVAVGFAYLFFLSSLEPRLGFMRGYAVYLMYAALGLAVYLTLLSGIVFLKNNRSLLNTQDFAKFTSALGVGLIPFAPGTWGSAAGILFVIMTAAHTSLYVISFFCFVLAGWWAVGKLDLMGHEDPHYVVVDECCGIFVTFFMVPLDIAVIAAGFLLFRFFDVVKPFPLRRLERIAGFWGILADDLGAGIYAWIALQIFVRVWQ